MGGDGDGKFFVVEKILLLIIGGKLKAVNTINKLKAVNTINV